MLSHKGLLKRIRYLRIANDRLKKSNMEYKAALIIVKRQLESMGRNIVIPTDKVNNKVYFVGGKGHD